jgi:hypothetical protein
VLLLELESLVAPLVVVVMLGAPLVLLPPPLLLGAPLVLGAVFGPLGLGVVAVARVEVGGGLFEAVHRARHALFQLLQRVRAAGGGLRAHLLRPLPHAARRLPQSPVLAAHPPHHSLQFRLHATKERVRTLWRGHGGGLRNTFLISPPEINICLIIFTGSNEEKGQKIKFSPG